MDEEEYYDCVLGALAEATDCEAVGDSQGAAKVLRVALNKKQQDPRAPFDETGALFSEEDPPLCIAQSVGWNRLAGLLIQEGVLSEALDALESSLKLWPRNSLALLNLADLHFIYGEIAVARDAYASIKQDLCDAEPGTWQYDWVVCPRSDCAPIARYLLSLVLHQTGDYDAGKHALTAFGCTRRLSPELWRKAAVRGASSTSDSCEGLAEFVEEAWPVELHANLKRAFAADAPFWRETDYGQRGYYSFWLPDDSGDDGAVSTLIRRHIRPLAEAFLKDEQKIKICGAEWWVHTKPANGR
jgi:tetratricopeptide (TPR) repeat protein